MNVKCCHKCWVIYYVDPSNPWAQPICECHRPNWRSQTWTTQYTNEPATYSYTTVPVRNLAARIRITREAMEGSINMEPGQAWREAMARETEITREQVREERQRRAMSDISRTTYRDWVWETFGEGAQQDPSDE